MPAVGDRAERSAQAPRVFHAVPERDPVVPRAPEAEARAADAVEIGTWVPPHDGQVWNVAFMGDLLLVGDIENGLFILRR